MDDVVYYCRLHEHELPEIPPGAILASHRRGPYKLYRFLNGDFHDIRKIRVESPEPVAVVESTPKPAEPIPVAPVAVPEPPPPRDVTELVSDLQRKWGVKD